MMMAKTPGPKMLQHPAMCNTAGAAFYATHLQYGRRGVATTFPAAKTWLWLIVLVACPGHGVAESVCTHALQFSAHKIALLLLHINFLKQRVGGGDCRFVFPKWPTKRALVLAVVLLLLLGAEHGTDFLQQ
ncbi:hypothetical protein QAD02_000677 [Eretmocerus hayati]|uniref:Uncharacterized protein n=1 Tax=Eretmocerus hayati TaxID=131215 RepID=A0ACC2NER3_9HYME|nr:hypothetical protein QAD02_000677 [Eretmocerus hayati]